MRSFCHDGVLSAVNETWLPHDHQHRTQARLSPPYPASGSWPAGRRPGRCSPSPKRAEGLGYDSIWIGDSLLAKPRHDPITLMAAVAARTERVSIGSAVLLPALRNPVVLAQQLATLDRIAEGRLILGVGIAADVPSIHAEFEAAGVPFEKRVGRMLEGLRLCRALWSGEPVDWEGRWPVRQGTLAPTPAHRRRAADLGRRHGPGQPGAGRAALRRLVSDRSRAGAWGEQWREVQEIAATAGRAGAVGAAIYLTLAIDEDARAGDARIDAYLEGYYGAPAALLRKHQSVFAGPPEAAAGWLKRYADEGAEHLMLRFVGDHERMLETVAALRAELGWT